MPFRTRPVDQLRTDFQGKIATLEAKMVAMDIKHAERADKIERTVQGVSSEVQGLSAGVHEGNVRVANMQTSFEGAMANLTEMMANNMSKLSANMDSLAGKIGDDQDRSRSKGAARAIRPRLSRSPDHPGGAAPAVADGHAQGR